MGIGPLVGPCAVFRVNGSNERTLKVGHGVVGIVLLPTISAPRSGHVGSPCVSLVWPWATNLVGGACAGFRVSMSAGKPAWVNGDLAPLYIYGRSAKTPSE